MLKVNVPEPLEVGVKLYGTPTVACKGGAPSSERSMPRWADADADADVGTGSTVPHDASSTATRQ